MNARTPQLAPPLSSAKSPRPTRALGLLACLLLALIERNRARARQTSTTTIVEV